jgi:hypothetical protein
LIRIVSGAVVVVPPSLSVTRTASAYAPARGASECAQVKGAAAGGIVFVQLATTTVSSRNSTLLTEPSESLTELTVAVVVTAVAEVTTGPLGLIETTAFGFALTRTAIEVSFFVPVASVATALIVYVLADEFDQLVESGLVALVAICDSVPPLGIRDIARLERPSVSDADAVIFIVAPV